MGGGLTNGELAKAIAACPQDMATGRLATADAWTREDTLAKAMIPSLADAACYGTIVTNGRLVAQTLCETLRQTYERVLRPLLPDTPTPAVSTTSFSDFRGGKGSPKRSPIPLLFLIELDGEITKGRFVDNARIQNLLAAFNPITHLIAHFRDGAPLPNSTSHQATSNQRLSERVLAENALYNGFRTLMGLEDGDKVSRDFFNAGRETEKSYFLVMRRATQGNRIIKGFLAIDPPSDSGNKAHTFSHFQENTSGDFRETHGFVLGLKHGYYFLGGTGHGKRKKRFQKGTSTSRRNLSEALKCVALRENANALGKDLWHGLFISHGPEFAPIVGRCVLVRTHCVSYQDAEIGYFAATQGALKTELKKFAAPSIIEHSSTRLAAIAAGVLKSVDNSAHPGQDRAKPIKALRPLE